MNFEINYEALLLGLPIFIISGAIHEFAHAFFADIQGDPTARINGRLTINPIAHIDLIGTILFPVINILTGFKIFGWMRPVPTNPNNFKNPSKGQAIVAFAGPFSNFIQAAIGALLFKIILILKFYFFGDSSELILNSFSILGKVLNFYISINILLMFFNLFPFPPLDGGWILRHLLPDKGKAFYDRIYPFGFIILFVLLFTGIFNIIFLLPSMILINFIFSGFNDNRIISMLYYLIPVLFSSGLLYLLIKPNILKRNKNNDYNKATEVTDKNEIQISEIVDDSKNDVLTIINKINNKNELDDNDRKTILQSLKIKTSTPICKEVDFNINDGYCKECENFLKCILRYLSSIDKKKYSINDNI